MLCALDRIFDDTTMFKLRGESFRGKKLETVSLQTGKVKAVKPMPVTEEQSFCQSGLFDLFMTLDWLFCRMLSE